VLDIRSAKRVRVGQGDLGSFKECSINTPQQGNAVEIYPTSQTNRFVRYYVDASDKMLKWTTNGAAAATVMAHSVSNLVVFTAEDFAGNVLTNNDNNQVIGLNLQFSQLFNSSMPVGPGNFLDYYQIRTRVTLR
jgi:hypothetical protein